MKKFSSLIAVLLIVMMMVSSVAFASESIHVSASYSNGVLSWTVSDFCDLYTVYANGQKLVNYSNASGSYKISLDTTEDIKVKVVDLMGHSDSTTIKGSAPVPTEAPVEPTEAPVEPTEAPVEPTEAPVEPTEAPVEPTEAPVEPTEAPVEPTEAPVEPTEAPTQAPADDDDEVPKTGDSATASYLMGGAMVLAAAYLLLRRRVHSK